MLTHYEHHLHTGSGWKKAILTFSDEAIATIYFDLRWMGSDLLRYKLTWSHERLSQTYGLLRLLTIERYTTLDSDATVVEDLDAIIREPDLDDEMRAFYREIAYEYILLPKSEVWLPNDPGLADMRTMGYAWWHESFDLILLLHFSVAIIDGKLRETALGQVLSMLDKMKFKSVVDPVFGYTIPPRSNHGDGDIPF